MTPEELVGRNVATLRKVRGMTQADLAVAMASAGHPLHQSAIAKIEGASRPLRVNELTALASILGVNPAALMEETDERDLDRVRAERRVELAQLEEASAAEAVLAADQRLRAAREELDAANRALYDATNESLWEG